MTAVTITNHETTADTDVQRVKFLEAVAKYSIVCRSASDDWQQCDADEDAEHSGVLEVGLLISEVNAIDGYGDVVTAGSVKINGGLALAETYIVGLAGALNPIGDKATGWYLTHIGICTDAAGTFDTLVIKPNASGVAVPVP